MALPDPAIAWEVVGFNIVDNSVSVGDLTVALGRPIGRPQWWFEPSLTSPIHGVDQALPAENPGRSNPNGATSVDHIVVMSPNLETTTAALEEQGFELRRSRPIGKQEQRFFWAGTVIIEVVGPGVPEAEGPARIWGLALVSEDLDASKALLGERLSDPKDAVQPGRRIAAIRTAEHDISIMLALMTPR